MDAPRAGEPQLAKALGPFDATMLVMGGIVGSGIFLNPAVVARQLGAPASILAAWVAGGAIALAGAFVSAELGARAPHVGGQYAWLRDAYHPSVGFLYGWVLLLVINAGGSAAVATTFARYLNELLGTAVPDAAIATAALAALTAINCLGAKPGSAVQNVLMVLKISAIAALAFCGAWVFARSGMPASPAPAAAAHFGAALVPVLFAYGGWQTASFVAAELRNPERDLPRALLFGVLGVIALYLAVTLACLGALGAAGLAATQAPASSVMRLALGEAGGKLIAAGIALSTVGFLCQSLLTMPRVYLAMARDGLFFRSVAAIHPRTRAPVVAIVLQGAMSIAVALSGRYEQILAYVVAMDWIFSALTAGCVFVFRRRHGRPPGASVPGHPFTTAAFIAASTYVVLSTFAAFPWNSAIGLLLLLAGIPVFAAWRGR